MQVYKSCGTKQLRRQLVPTLEVGAVVKRLVLNDPLCLFERLQGPLELSQIAICDAWDRVMEDDQRAPARPGP